jgi:hypothetical protein
MEIAKWVLYYTMCVSLFAKRKKISSKNVFNYLIEIPALIWRSAAFYRFIP